MNDELRPLLAGDLEPELRWVLESSRHDGPSPQQVQAAALALGLGAGAAKATAAGAAGQGVLKGASFWLLKWFGVGLLVGGLSSSGVALVRSQAAPAESSASRAPATQAERGTPTLAAPSLLGRAESESAGNEAAAKDSIPREPARSARPDVESGGAPSDVGAQPVAAGPSAASFPSASPLADLRAEVVFVDAARRALASGDPQGALVELGRYDALVGPKRLAPEALVLKVRALAKVGRVQEARALAQPVIASQPESARARQLRAALGLE